MSESKAELLQGPDVVSGHIESRLLPVTERRLVVHAAPNGELRRFSTEALLLSSQEDNDDDVGGGEDASDDDFGAAAVGTHATDLTVRVLQDLPDPLPDKLALYKGLPTLYNFADVLLTGVTLEDTTQLMTVDHLLQCLDELHAKYLKDVSTNFTPALVYDLLGFDPQNYITPDLLSERRIKLDTLVLGLYNHCLQRHIIVPSQVGGTLLEGRVKRIRDMIGNLCQSLQVYQRIVQGCNINVAAQAGAPLDLVENRVQDDSKKAELVILHLLNVAQTNSFSKMDDYVYGQTITTYNGRAYFTHAWYQLCDMKEFLHLNVRKEDNYVVWSAFVSSVSIEHKVVEYLKNCFDHELPRLKPNRRVFSFKNGLYFADELKFRSYEDIQAGREHVESSLVACKFFDQEFYDFQGLPAEVHGVLSWMDIPTPAFESILRDQHLGADYDANLKRGDPGYSDAEEQRVHQWIYALLGRLMYRVGELDNWQVILFIHGKANTGKSTIANMIQKLYLKQNIGVLSNNIESKFGLSALLNKFFYICYELKNDFGLDQSEFQSMVSGEDMSVAVKGKTAVSVKWDQPGLFLGNTYASTWLDNSGSISRRLVIVDFFQEIVASDPQLDAKLEAEMPNLIQKMNLAYLWMVWKYGRRGIWDKSSALGEQVLPDYFHCTQKRMLTTTHPLRLFIHSHMSEWYVLNPAGYVPLTDFYRRFRERTPQFERSRSVWAPEYYRAPFAAYGLAVTPSEPRDWEGEQRVEIWLKGVSPVGVAAAAAAAAANRNK